MKHSIKKGFSFGLTSGIITTLGLMVGLNSSTHSTSIVVGGILVIAIADAASDALGIHISEESENHHSKREIWEATIVTFLGKFVFASIFLVPVVILPLAPAIITSIALGILLLGFFSYYLAIEQKVKPYKVIIEHLVIASLVIYITYYIGGIVNKFN